MDREAYLDELWERFSIPAASPKASSPGPGSPSVDDLKLRLKDAVSLFYLKYCGTDARYPPTWSMQLTHIVELHKAIDDTAGSRCKTIFHDESRFHHVVKSSLHGLKEFVPELVLNSQTSSPSKSRHGKGSDHHAKDHSPSTLAANLNKIWETLSSSPNNLSLFTIAASPKEQRHAFDAMLAASGPVPRPAVSATPVTTIHEITYPLYEALVVITSPGERVYRFTSALRMWDGLGRFLFDRRLYLSCIATATGKEIPKLNLSKEKPKPDDSLRHEESEPEASPTVVSSLTAATREDDEIVHRFFFELELAAPAAATAAFDSQPQTRQKKKKKGHSTPEPSPQPKESSPELHGGGGTVAAGNDQSPSSAPPVEIDLELHADDDYYHEPCDCSCCNGRPAQFCDAVTDIVSENKGKLGFLLFLLCLLTVILVPMSLESVDATQVAIFYDSLSCKLGNATLGPGLYNVGPSGNLIKFPSTQQVMLFTVSTQTMDSIQLKLSLELAFSYHTKRLSDIINDWAEETNFKKYIREVTRNCVHNAAARTPARDFLEEPSTVQIRLQDEVMLFAEKNDIPIFIDYFQLQGIDYPDSFDRAFLATTVAFQEMTNAIYERSRDIQAASIRLALTEASTRLTLLKADVTATKTTIASDTNVAIQSSRLKQYKEVFTNVSGALGLGGDFFVDQYVPAVVLKVNDAAKKYVELQ